MDLSQSITLTQEQLNAMMQTMIQNLQNTQQVVPAAQEPPSFPKLNKEFASLGVTKFYRDGSAEKAFEWVEEMEWHFEKMKSTPVEKTQLGTQQLKGLTLTWWNTVCASKDVKEMEWDEFKKMFIREFVPRAKQSVLMVRFLSFRQEARTVEKYYQDFKELARYAPALVAEETTKVERFITGLRPEIKVQMAGSYDDDMWTVYNHALRVESSVAEQKEKKNFYVGEGSGSAGPERDQGNQGKYYNNRRGGGYRRQYRPYNRDQRAPAAQPERAQGPIQQLPAPPARLALPAPVAAQQGVAARICYDCREIGHMARDCPNPRCREQQAPARGRGGFRGRGANQPAHQGARAYAALADQPYIEELIFPDGGATFPVEQDQQDQ